MDREYQGGGGGGGGGGYDGPHRRPFGRSQSTNEIFYASDLPAEVHITYYNDRY